MVTYSKLPSIGSIGQLIENEVLSRLYRQGGPHEVHVKCGVASYKNFKIPRHCYSIEHWFSKLLDIGSPNNFENLYSLSKHDRQPTISNTYEIKSNNNPRQKHSKLTSNLATRLAHTLGREKSKYS